jgi:multicomponent Na+:H+ antiporter subunit B
MNSILLQTIGRLLTALLFIVSVVIFLRGHHLPGGGFIGGLMAGIGFLLYAIIYGFETLGHRWKLFFEWMMGAGLLCAFVSVFLFDEGKAPMTGRWIEWSGLKVGSPFLFDLGVYWVVLGISVIIIQQLTETTES